MKIIGVLLALAGCLIIAGCTTKTAEVLARPGVAQGPAVGPDFGLVRYLADGSAADVEARQQDANHQMYAACGGKYRVLAKGTRNQLDLRRGGRFGRDVWATNESYVYIKFVCTQG